MPFDDDTGASVLQGRTRARRILRMAILGAVTVIVFVALLRRIDHREVAAAMAVADLWLCLLAMLVSTVLCLGTGTLRLGTLLRPLTSTPPRFMDLWSIWVASGAVYNLLPSPASEVVRGVQLGRTYGHTAGVLVVVLLAEKMLEVLTAGAAMLLVGLWLPLPPAVARPLVVLGAAAVVGVPAVLAIAWYWQAGRAQATATEPVPSAGGRFWTRLLAAGHRFVGRLAEGLQRLRCRRTWAVALGWSLIYDLGMAITVGLVLAAVGRPESLPVWYAVVVVNRVCSLLPAGPGQLGVREAGIVVALGVVGIDPARALAVALLFRLVHFAPVILFAPVALPRVLSTRTPRALPAAARPGAASALR